MKPKGNGLVTLHDDRLNEHGFFCIKLVEFLNTEAELGTEEYRRLWDERFSMAKRNSCYYKDRCPIYAQSIQTHTGTPR